MEQENGSIVMVAVMVLCVELFFVKRLPFIGIHRLPYYKYLNENGKNKEIKPI